MLRVYIVDDERMAVQYLEYLLTHAQAACEVVGSATNSARALEEILRMKPDVVFTDISMPVMNGLELARRVLEKQRARIYLLTSYEDFQYAKQGVKIGVSDYILKNELSESLLSELLERAEAELILERGKSIFALSEEMSDGWALITEISVPALMRLSLAAISKLFLLFLVMMLLTAALLSYLIRRIVTPINQLSEAVSAVGRGDLDIHVDIHTDDEIEELADAFNHMVVNIDKLIYESVEHEKKIQQMQMENLMLQINPHFIYNTMNSIVYMARMGGVPQIAEFTNAFISLLQSTLRVRNSVFVSLRDELKTVRSYLYLQKFRYGNKFSAQINCPEELLDCQILNVMLQPVVENSIFHGIAPKEGQGHISISAQHSGSELILQVEDDGVGISEEALREITREDYSQSFGVHKIGIGNVRKRIHEIYGANSTLDVESKLGCWTRVTMRIPYRVEPTQGAEHDRDMAKE